MTPRILLDSFLGIDHEQRRLVWSVLQGPFTHHNASAQVFATGDGARVVWTADFLPHDAAEFIAGLMDAGLEAIRRTLSRAPAV